MTNCDTRESCLDRGGTQHDKPIVGAEQGLGGSIHSASLRLTLDDAVQIEKYVEGSECVLLLEDVADRS